MIDGVLDLELLANANAEYCQYCRCVNGVAERRRVDYVSWSWLLGLGGHEHELMVSRSSLLVIVMSMSHVGIITIYLPAIFEYLSRRSLLPAIF